MKVQNSTHWISIVIQTLYPSLLRTKISNCIFQTLPQCKSQVWKKESLPPLKSFFTWSQHSSTFLILKCLNSHFSYSVPISSPFILWTWCLTKSGKYIYNLHLKSRKMHIEYAHHNFVFLITCLPTNIFMQNTV